MDRDPQPSPLRTPAQPRQKAQQNPTTPKARARPAQKAQRAPATARPPQRDRAAPARDRLRDWAWRRGVECGLAAGPHRLLLWLVEQVEMGDLTLHTSNSDIGRALGLHWSGITSLRRRLVKAGLVQVEVAVAVGLGRQMEWQLLAEF